MTLEFHHPVERLKFRHLELWGNLYAAGFRGAALAPDEIGDWLVDLVGEGITPYYADRMLTLSRQVLSKRAVQEKLLKEWCTLADFWEGWQPVWFGGLGVVGDNRSLLLTPRALAEQLVYSANFRSNAPILISLGVSPRWQFRAQRGGTVEIPGMARGTPVLHLEFPPMPYPARRGRLHTTSAVSRETRIRRVQGWIEQAFIDFVCLGERRRTLEVIGDVILEKSVQLAESVEAVILSRWETSIYDEMSDEQVADVFNMFREYL